TSGFGGLTLNVVGIIKTTALTDFVDLDNEWITPIDTTVQQPTSPPHHPAQRNIIIPYQLYARMAFPTLVMTIAVKPFNTSEIPQLAEEFALKTVFDVFYGIGETTYLIRARQWIQLMGATQIWIPIIIASLTILSLMLGNVSEREGEIKIYNAVGMSPSHITQMFLVESLSYAAPAVVIGYLGGILSTVILIQMGLYPVGLYPNFSSLIIVVIMGIDIAMVLSAAIYPALLLSKLAVPSLTRRWKVAKPKGDLWEIPLPFVATDRETNGFFEFFREYLMSYSLERYGTFHTLSISFHSETKPPREIVKRITARMRLAPYDLGIEQDASIVGVCKEADIYRFILSIQRIRGYRDQWITSNRPFIDTVRKQWLIWRALPPSEREKYIERAKDGLMS
ncbi:MAG: FtsX-like permease family protein, partial [Candidatus Bathyarchaeia archaeon]